MASETDPLLGNVHNSSKSREQNEVETVSNETGLDSTVNDIYNVQNKRRTTTT